MEKNRKTNIPVDRVPKIITWLLKNCTEEEIIFMSGLSSKKNIGLLNSIFSRLTDALVYEVFYKDVSSAEELLVIRASSRGEVAGLKAFSQACQVAREEVERRKPKKKK